MNLQSLLSNIKILELLGNPDREVSGITIDSRKCSAGSVYIAMVGSSSDGHDYVEQATEAGAVAVVVLRKINSLPEEVCQIIVSDTRQAAGVLASAFFGNPASKLTLVGITGTNGKTSSVTLLHDVFLNLGKKSALFSTVVNKLGIEILPATHTTPDVISFHEMLAKAVDAGCEYVFMEVSSHGIDQQRTAGASFKIAGFTNITRDHLDYHHTFQEYRDVKKKLFDHLSEDAVAIVNIDDRNGPFMLQNTKAVKKTFALKTLADYHCKILESDFNGMLLKLNDQEVHTALTGKFNAYNLTLVYAIARELGVEEHSLLQALSLAGRVRGRFETHRSASGIFVVVDYAHTPDALQNVLDSINALRKTSERLITVIGCGGDRDKGKRPQMAEVSVLNSTLSIFTSDNPRTENPKSILDDMVAGVPEEKRNAYTTIENRREAITMAVRHAEPGDIILIAGKGHETYQEIGGVRENFDDAQVVREILTQAGK